jgi:hypothetical protein
MGTPEIRGRKMRTEQHPRTAEERRLAEALRTARSRKLRSRRKRRGRIATESGHHAAETGGSAG